MVHTHSFFPISLDDISQGLSNAQSKFNNFSLSPDDLFLKPGTVPILSIRNPRLAVPSAYRAMQSIMVNISKANLQLVACPVWTCLLFDYYTARGFEPLVVDADDYMTDTTFVETLCKKSGLDPKQVNHSWSLTSQQDKESFEKPYVAVQETLMSSTSANPNRAAKNIDLEAEEAKWESEFGESVVLIRELVELAIPFYEYLYQRRLQA